MANSISAENASSGTYGSLIIPNQQNWYVDIAVNLFIALFISIVTILISAFALSSAEKSEYISEPEGIVNAFCQADFNGTGLSAAGWPIVQRYTIWQNAPGWDTVDIISEFRITNVNKKIETAEVNVNYKILGELVSGEKISSIEKNIHTEDINYKLIKINGHWKIKEPQMRPHISVKAAIGELEREIKGTTSAELKRKINENINFLKNMKGEIKENAYSKSERKEGAIS